MTLGRPTTISKTEASSVPFPASIDDEFLSTTRDVDGFQPEGKASVTEFYIQTVKLYVLQEETLSVMYSDRITQTGLAASGHLSHLDFNTVLALDASLRRWNEAIPDFLKFRSSSTEEPAVPVFSKQANILHLRYATLHASQLEHGMINFIPAGYKSKYFCYGPCFLCC